MLNHNDMVDGLEDGVVAFRDSKFPSVPSLPSDLLNSLYGLYFDDYYPMNTIKNLYAILPNYETEYAPFKFILGDIYPIGRMSVASIGLIEYLFQSQVDSNTNNTPVITPFLKDILSFDPLNSYSIGEYSVYQGLAYVSLTNGNLGNNPDTNPLEWSLPAWIALQPKPTFEQTLREKRRAAINKVLRDKEFIVKLGKFTKSIFQETTLFDGIPDFKNLETKSSRFVGFRVKVSSQEGLKAVLHRMSFMFTEEQIDLNIYLYHSSQQDAISVTPLSFNNPNSSSPWTDFNIDLLYNNSIIDSGGVFYIGYYEDDIQGQAINKTYSRNGYYANSNYGLYQYNDYGYRWWGYYPRTCGTELMSITPFSINNDNLNGVQIPNIGYQEKNVIPTYNKSYGMNLTTSVQCDLTSFFLRHKSLFAQAIGLQFSVLVNEEILKSIEVNSNNENLYPNAVHEVEQSNLEKQKKHDIYTEYQKAIKALNFDFSDLPSICLVKQQKGVRFGAA